MKAHTGPVLCVGTSDTMAVSGGRDSLVVVWDLETGMRRN